MIRQAGLRGLFAPGDGGFLSTGQRLRREALLAGLEEENWLELSRFRFTYLAAIAPFPHGEEAGRYNALHEQRREAYFRVLEDAMPHLDWSRPEPGERKEGAEEGAEEGAAALSPPALTAAQRAAVEFYRRQGQTPTPAA